MKAEQLTMFEPEGVEALALMQKHARAFEVSEAQAALWDACLCPGARDAALSQADAALSAWLVFALLLDIEREASL
jgi:hypothetical protein